MKFMFTKNILFTNTLFFTVIVIGLLITNTAYAKNQPPALISGEADGIFIADYAISSDENWVVYVADQDNDEISDINSVPIAGGKPTILSKSLSNNGHVNYHRNSPFIISNDNRYVVFLANSGYFTRGRELYSVPINGGVPVKLNGSLVEDGLVYEDFQISPDSKYVVYRANQNIPNVEEIYSVPITGGTPVRLNRPLAQDFDVGDYFDISPDSNWVVYKSDTDSQHKDKLYSVSIKGGTPVKLSGNLPLQDIISFGHDAVIISPDSRRVVYKITQGTQYIKDIYSVPIIGGDAVKLNRDLMPDRYVAKFQISPDSKNVLYIANGHQSGDLFSLFNVPITGGTPIRLNHNGPPVDVNSLQNMHISPDGKYVIYAAYLMYEGYQQQLYRVLINGGPVTNLNKPVPSANNAFYINKHSNQIIYRGPYRSSHFNSLFSRPIFGGQAIQLYQPTAATSGIPHHAISIKNNTVFYLADQGLDDIFELYSTSAYTAYSRKLSHKLPINNYVGRFLISENSNYAVYLTSNKKNELKRALFSVLLRPKNKTCPACILLLLE